MDTLDQLYLILGDVSMSREDFLSVVQEGLTGEVVSVVPDTADRVLIGDVMHTVPGEDLKVLFVLGAGEGMLPADRHDDGLLSNSELLLLKRCGLSVGTGTDRRMALDRYALYLAIAAASEKLVFTHSMTVDGHESLMSGFLVRIRESTGVKPVLHNGTEQEPASERIGFRLLAEGLRDHPEEPGTQALLAYYRTRPEYRAHADEMLLRSKGLVQPAPVERTLARRLFREGQSMSVSRLEQFSGCPYRHFLCYGLKAEIRREAGLKATDLGTFYHAVVERFVKTVIEQGLDFEELAKAEERIGALVDEIIPEVVGETGDGILKTDARLAAQIPLLTENVRFTCRAIVRQIAAGSFRPVGAEARFKRNGAYPEIKLDLGNGRTAILEGIIDRVDATAPGPDGKRLCRVIDYKTAGRKMEYENIEEGLHMQLPLYLYAVESANEEVEPAGMYYVKISPAPEKDTDNAEKEQAEILKQLRLSGITVDSEESLHAAGKTPEDVSAAILGARVKKDGEPYANDSFCTPRQMRLFMRHVKRIAEEKAAEMFDGNITIDPAPKACGYCDFRSVCGFDAKLGCRVRTLKKMDRDAFLDHLEKDRPEKEEEKQ